MKKRNFIILGAKGSGGSTPTPDIPTPTYDYLVFENLEDTEGTITFNRFLLNVEVSEDDFKTKTIYNGRFTYPIKAKSKVWIKWEELSFEGGEGQNITVDKQHKISGVLKNGNIPNAYSYMFRNNTKLVDASELKLTANTLASSCYSNMFRGCSSLTTAPELPATTLDDYCYSYMFNGCSSLTTAPELPAITLKEHCYNYMFNGCKSLTTAPELPVTTLDDYCYICMFQDCTSLTTAPSILPATTLASSCYGYMFSGCKSLTTAPELPATTLADYCYSHMFESCTSLTTAPTLPATTLDDYCYNYMFSGCKSLTTAPELPATTLAKNCYYYMFQNCTALTTAPSILPATTLASSCYSYMFSGCTNINYVKTNIITWNKSYTSDWLSGVASEGTVETPSLNIPTNDSSGVPRGWTKKEIPMNFADALILTNLSEEQNTFTVNLPTSQTYSYKINNDEWASISGNNSFTVEGGSKLYLLNTIRTSSSTNTAMITATANFKVSGTLPYGDIPSAYSYMFKNNTKLVDASELKLTATTLASSCYSYMFSGCKSLTTAPSILPATTLAISCYSYMFENCSSLTTAPELPATTLASSCYSYMFSGCKSLTTAPSILPATTLAISCYSYMFENCSSLTTAPELPATTLASSCYSYMFKGCTNINYVKTNIITWNQSYTSDWLSNVASSGTVETPSLNIPTNGSSGVPRGWTKKLINYNEMFPEDEPTEPEIEPDYTEYTDMLYFAPRTYTTNVQVKISEDCIVDKFKYTTSPLFNTDIKSLNYDELNYPTVSKGETIEIDSLSGTSILWKGALRNSSSVDTPIFEIITDTEENNKVQVQGELNNGSFDYAYYYMFSGNTALSNIGTGLVLTSEYVGRSAYQNMFFNCSNFDDGGDVHISAKVVDAYGLGAMFSGCNSLKTAPHLGGIKEVGTYGMAYMFANTAITTAPVLSATTVSPYSTYQNIFEGCLNLNYVKIALTEWNTTITSDWLKGVGSEGTIETNATNIPIGSSGVPNGWTVKPIV